MSGPLGQDPNKDGWLTIAAPVVTQAVIASEQVQRRVQVRVNLVYSIADRFQRHPPVWRLRLMVVRGQTARKVEGQGEKASKTAKVHSPRHVPEGPGVTQHICSSLPQLFRRTFSSCHDRCQNCFSFQEKSNDRDGNDGTRQPSSCCRNGGENHFRVLSRDWRGNHFQLAVNESQQWTTMAYILRIINFLPLMVRWGNQPRSIFKLPPSSWDITHSFNLEKLLELPTRWRSDTMMVSVINA